MNRYSCGGSLRRTRASVADFCAFSFAQVNFKSKGKNTHRLTYVVSSRSASVAPSEKRAD